MVLSSGGLTQYQHFCLQAPKYVLPQEMDPSATVLKFARKITNVSSVSVIWMMSKPLAPEEAGQSIS